MILFDDFESTNGWAYPVYSYGFIDSGTAFFDGGILTIRHEPKYKFHTVSAVKNYDIEIIGNLEIEFGFRMKEILIGADMYSRIEIDDELLIELGINGEQHWQVFENCLPKPIDDEIFFSAPILGLAGHSNDLRVGYNRKIGYSYTDWMIFSVILEGGNASKRLRIFIDSQEVEYRALDERPDINAINTSINSSAIANLAPGQHKLTVKFSVMSDGNLYGKPDDWSKENGFPIRNGFNHRRCHAHFSPAIPVLLAQPENRNKLEWMNQYDTLYDEKEEHILTDANVVWQGIYGGSIQLEAAVLVGAISLPLESHPQWQYQNIGTKYNDVKMRLEHLNRQYSPNMPMEKRFIWDSIYRVGGASIAVYWGYLTPEEVRNSPQWVQMSETEKKEVPEVAIIKASEMQWDFISIKSC